MAGKGYRFIAPVEVLEESSRKFFPDGRVFPEARSDPRNHNLTAQLTRFVGRQKELRELRGVLASSRLLSLTGAGGVGKTQTALRLVLEFLNDFPDGVWLVDLAPLSLHDLVAQTVSTVLGVKETPERSVRDALVDSLRNRQLLLILDTCEHLISECAELVEVLLREAPGLRILATSREALGIPGETVWRVPSLSLPQTLAPSPVDALVRADATLLFIERARAADLSSRLIEKSLLISDGDFAGERRYRLLETVRHYAGARLMQTGETAQFRDRHFRYFYAQFRDMLTILSRHDQVPCLQRLRVELENVRATLEWAMTSPELTEKGVELAGSLFWFWMKSGGFEEGKRWLEQALVLPGPVRGSIRARALIGLAHMRIFQGRMSEVRELAAEALQLGRDDSDPWIVSFALFLQGTSAFELGDNKFAEMRSREALAAAESASDTWLRAGPLLVLGQVSASEGDHDRAHTLYAESADVLRDVGDSWALGIVLAAAASEAIIREDFALAQAQASEALLLCEELDDTRGIAHSLEVFAGLLAAAGFAEAAARLWGAAEVGLSKVGGSLAASIRWIRDRYIAGAQSAAGELLFEAARTEGRAMSSMQAIAFARQWENQVSQKTFEPI